jgi:hypothetical protein
LDSGQVRSAVRSFTIGAFEPLGVVGAHDEPAFVVPMKSTSSEVGTDTRFEARHVVAVAQATSSIWFVPGGAD